MRDYFTVYRSQAIVFGAFFFTALLIVLLHLMFHPVRVLGMDISIFYMDEKYTLAAFFSTVTSFLVGFIGMTNASKCKLTIGKLTTIAHGLFFIILAVDEYFEIHEYTNTLIKERVTEEGLVQSLVNLSWIFPLLLIILVVLILFIVKINISKQGIKTPLILGTVCFAVVLIFELLGSATYGQDIYVYLIAVEEGLEMIGVSFFLLAALIESELLSA